MTTRKDALAKLMPFQMGFLGSACLYVAAKLEIADRLIAGPRPSDELAAEAGADAGMLYRILRYLASEGIFEERADRVFALNDVAELMRSDVEQSFQPFTVMNSERAFEAVLELLPAVQAGEIPFVRRFGEHPFDMMRDDPTAAARLERGWQGVHGPETAAFLEAFDFTDIGKFADIGGGHGDVVIGFLDGDPARTGAIFDIPAVCGHLSQRLEKAGLAARCEVIAGDFFESIPVAADAYFLRHILHDWNDEECLTILRNIAARCRPGSRVLIAECVIKEPNVTDRGKLLDMEMLLFLSGKERTANEYRDLLEASGFEYVGITTTDSIIDVVEGRFTGTGRGH
jgi:hypothetical protein